MENSKLKQLRIEKGYSLKEFSIKTGVSTTYLNDLENGIRDNPSLDIIDKIAKGLKEDLVKVFYIIKDLNKS